MSICGNRTKNRAYYQRKRVMRRSAPYAAFTAAALLPFFLAAGGDTLDNLVLAAAYVVMALGLNVVVGFAGLLDLGYVAFFAIGAHVAALLRLGVPRHPPQLPAGRSCSRSALTALAGVLIGLPTLRLRGDYVGIVTLAFGEIIGQVGVQRPRDPPVRRHR